MTRSEWGDTISLSIPEIDREHAELVAMADEFSRALDADESRAKVEQRLTRLIEAFVRHCAGEEDLMRSSGYPGLAAHEAEHRKLIAQMTGLRQDLSAGVVNLCTALGAFVQMWTGQHIAGPDAAFAGFLRGSR